MPVDVMVGNRPGAKEEGDNYNFNNPLPIGRAKTKFRE